MAWAHALNIKWKKARANNTCAYPLSVSAGCTRRPTKDDNRTSKGRDSGMMHDYPSEQPGNYVGVRRPPEEPP
jgi:hypothetical protein